MPFSCYTPLMVWVKNINCECEVDDKEVGQTDGAVKDGPGKVPAKSKFLDDASET